MTAPCNAYLPGLRRECGEPGVPVRRACVHEHVRDAHVCPLCLSMADLAYCRPCHELDGHD